MLKTKLSNEQIFAFIKSCCSLVFEDDSKWDAAEAIHIPDLFETIEFCKLVWTAKATKTKGL